MHIAPYVLLLSELFVYDLKFVLNDFESCLMLGTTAADLIDNEYMPLEGGVSCSVLNLLNFAM